MPLVDGDYTLEFAIRDGDEQQHLLWQIRHPYTVSVRGGGFHGGVIAGDGLWDVVDATPAPQSVALSPQSAR
jgi:hypothetical protein